MRRYLVLAFLLALTLPGTIAAGPQTEKIKVKPPARMSPRHREVEYVRGEVLVTFEKSISPDEVGELNKALGSSVMSIHGGGVRRLRVPGDLAEQEFISRLERDPRVRSASLNSVCHAFMIPDDPLYSYQWHFSAIGAEQAWDLSTGTDVIVGILDSGVAYEDYSIPAYESHTVRAGVTAYVQGPDFAETAFVPGYDFVNNDAHPNDNNDHGTHVAGTVAQTTNNSYGVAGVAFDTRLMPVKVLDYRGSGTALSLIDGLYFAVDNGAQVINMSLGWPPGDDPGQEVHDAIIYACDDGVVLVAASGNDGVGTVSYPAAYPEVIAVGAVRYDNQRAYYSQYGADLDLVAPGGDIFVDQNGDGYPDGILQETFEGYDPGPPEILADPTSSDFLFFQGTSMASPHVAGIAALLVDLGKTNVEIRTALLETAVDLGDPGWDQHYGSGLLDAHAALNYSPTPPIPGELHVTLEPVYPPAQDRYEPGDRPEFYMTVRDPQDGHAFVDVDRTRLWKSPPGLYLTPVDHISTGHYHYGPGQPISQGWYTFSFLVEKTGYIDTGTSLRLCVGSCDSPCEPPSVTDLMVRPSHFCPDTSCCPVRITCYLSHPCQVDAAIYRTATSELVRTLLAEEGKPAGADTLFWDLRDNRGSVVAQDDSYSVHVDAKRFIFEDLGDFGPELTEPSGIDIGDCGNGKLMYVTDRENHRVRVYDLNGSYVGEFGSAESGDLWYPEDVAVLGDYIYVADLHGDGRIQRFTCDYSPGPAINITGGYPIGLAAGPDGNLYVGNNFLRKFDPDLGIIDQEYFNAFRLTGLCVSPDTVIYATVQSGRKLYAFNSDLDSLCVFSVPSSGDSPDVDCRETPWGLWLYHRYAGWGISVYEVTGCSWTEINSYRLEGVGEMGVALDAAYVAATQSETVPAKALCDASGRSSGRVPLWSDGECCPAGITTDEWTELSKLTLSGIRPNPVLGAASIDYDVAHDGQISVNVYDARGRFVDELIDQPHTPGHYTVTWAGKNSTGTPMSPGIYFIRLQAGDQVATRKVVLIR